MSITDLSQDLLIGLDELLKDQQIIRQETHWDSALWQLLSSQGFADIEADDPEIGLAEFCAVARSVGRHALPLPLIETGFASWMASVTGLELPEGISVPAVASSDLQVTLEASGELRVHGTLHRIPWGRNADFILVLVSTELTAYLVALESRGDFRLDTNLAGEPRDTLYLDNVLVPQDRFVDAGALESLDIQLRGALLRATSQAGALERVLEMAIDYAEQREQFGKPIGSFQAVQHHLVTIAEAVAATNVAVDAAISSPAAYRRLAASAAKVTAARYSSPAAQSAHQVFGAIGVTQEHPLHFYTKRLWSWQDEYGSRSQWSQFIGDRLTFPGSPGAWVVLTPPHPSLDNRSLGEAVRW